MYFNINSWVQVNCSIFRRSQEIYKALARETGNSNTESEHNAMPQPNLKEISCLGIFIHPEIH